MRTSMIFLCIACIFFWYPQASAQTSAPSPEPINLTQAFAPYIGKTWVGTMSGETPATDVQVWESILGGSALRITHSLNDGEYGGETLIYVDKETNDPTYVYVTTAGFRTEGTFNIALDGSWRARENVQGHKTIAAVRSSGHITEQGKLVTASTYINKDGSETKGHSFIYVENADAELRFK